MNGEAFGLRMLLISQISIILISLLTAVLGPGYMPYIFMLYIIVIFAVTLVTTRRGSKPKPEELKVQLFKESNAMKAAMLDQKLNEELSKQFKGMLLSFAPLPLIFVLFYLYGLLLAPVVENSLRNVIGSETLLSFLNYLLLYEFIFAISFPLRWAIAKLYKFEQIMIPADYIVYRAGIKGQNVYIKFSKDLCYNYEPKRRFVELVPAKKGFKLRLYSERVSELKDKISSNNLIEECKA